MDDLSAQISLFGIAATLVSFLGGTLFGHRLALWRDRINNFNAIAAPIRERLIIERDNINQNGISAVDIDRLEQRLSYCKRRQFSKCIAAYRAAKSQTSHDEIGQPFYSNPQAVVRAIDALLPFTAPR